MPIENQPYSRLYTFFFTRLFEIPQLLASVNVFVALVVFILKYFAYHLTRSVALYSDALESIVNIATALVALITLTIVAKPADANHPYGHHKAEYFSAVFDGVFIILAAFSIVREAYFAIQVSREYFLTAEALMVYGIAGGINAIWSFILLREGRRQRSPAFIADGQHLFTDVISSLVVLAGLFIANIVKQPLVDPLLAMLVAIHILWSGWSLIRSSLAGLMDEAVEPQLLERIRTMISTHAEGAIEAHDVRTRHAGRVIFIDFHLVVPGSMTVSEAHAICDRIEIMLKREIKDGWITIHVEPEAKAKHRGILVV